MPRRARGSWPSLAIVASTICAASNVRPSTTGTPMTHPMTTRIRGRFHLRCCSHETTSALPLGVSVKVSAPSSCCVFVTAWNTLSWPTCSGYGRAQCACVCRARWRACATSLRPASSPLPRPPSSRRWHSAKPRLTEPRCRSARGVARSCPGVAHPQSGPVHPLGEAPPAASVVLHLRLPWLDPRVLRRREPWPLRHRRSLAPPPRRFPPLPPSQSLHRRHAEAPLAFSADSGIGCAPAATRRQRRNPSQPRTSCPSTTSRLPSSLPPWRSWRLTCRRLRSSQTCWRAAKHRARRVRPGAPAPRPNQPNQAGPSRFHISCDRKPITMGKTALAARRHSV